MQIYAIVGCNHSLPLWEGSGGLRGGPNRSPLTRSPLTVYLLFHQCKIKAQASFRSVGCRDAATMEENGMLYDGKSKAGAAQFARATLVYAIKAFEQSWQMLLADTGAVVLETYPILIFRATQKRHIYIPATGICYGILGQVAEDGAY